MMRLQSALMSVKVGSLNRPGTSDRVLPVRTSATSGWYKAAHCTVAWRSPSVLRGREFLMIAYPVQCARDGKALPQRAQMMLAK
jgi:hypothetical protein